MEKDDKKKNKINFYYNKNLILEDNENNYLNEEDDDLFNDNISDTSSSSYDDDDNIILNYDYNKYNIKYLVNNEFYDLNIKYVDNIYYPFYSESAQDSYINNYLNDDNINGRKYCPSCFNKFRKTSEKNDNIIYIIDNYIILCQNCYLNKYKIY